MPMASRTTQLVALHDGFPFLFVCLFVARSFCKEGSEAEVVLGSCAC